MTDIGIARVLSIKCVCRSDQLTVEPINRLNIYLLHFKRIMNVYLVSWLFCVDGGRWKCKLSRDQMLRIIAVLRAQLVLAIGCMASMRKIACLSAVLFPENNREL